MTRPKLSAKDYPVRLAAEFRDILNSLIAFLRAFFFKMDSGLLGKDVCLITQACFESWLQKSNRPLFSQIIDAFLNSPNTPERARHISERLTETFGFDKGLASECADYFIAHAGFRNIRSEARKSTFRLLSTAVDAFLAQTAHVIMGRIVLYRVAEDEEVLRRRFSGEALTTLEEDSRLGVAATPLSTR